jgi:hypothetical protein
MIGFSLAHELSLTLFIAAGWLTAYRCLRARRRVQDEDDVPDELAIRRSR